jgi:hypothetical protein
MSTSPDDVVQTLSWFLAGNAELEDVQQVLADPEELGPVAAGLVNELRQELAADDVAAAQLQPLIRETIEAIALGQ